MDVSGRSGRKEYSTALHNATRGEGAHSAAPGGNWLANHGYRQALQDDPHLRAGLNVHAGYITHPAVAEGLRLPYVPPERALGMGSGRAHA
jgi:alanine dehydrogenase